MEVGAIRTYRQADVIQTTCPSIWRSLPIVSVITVAIPEKMVDWAKANVTVRTKRHSVTVLGKYGDGIVRFWFLFLFEARQ